MSTALTEAKRPELTVGNSVGAIVPRDVEQAFRMAQLIVHAGMAPNGMNTPEKVVTAIMHGMEVGLKPMQALQSIAIVNGRPTIWGDAAIGLVQGSGLAEYIVERVEGEGDDMVAICEAKRHGWPSPAVSRFSVADAKLAGLWGKAGPWKQYPKRMLQMRARGFALRDTFADVLKGLGVREEARDFLMARDVTPTTSQPVRDLAAEFAAQANGTDEIETVEDDVPGHDPDTGEVEDFGFDDPATPALVPVPSDGETPKWADWLKAMGERIDALSTQEDLDLLKEANETAIASLRVTKATLADRLDKRFNDRSLEVSA